MNIDSKISFNDNNKPIFDLKEELSKYLYNNDDELFNEEEEIEVEDSKEKKTDDDNFLNEFNVILNKFKHSYLKIQDEFLKSEEKFKNELKQTREDVNSLEKMIDFINKLDPKFKDDEIYKQIIQKIQELTTKIEKKNNITDYKKEYIRCRRIVKDHFDIIKSLNNLNTSLLCPLCLSNRVEVYINLAVIVVVKSVRIDYYNMKVVLMVRIVLFVENQ